MPRHDGRAYISVPMDPPTKRAIEQAARHGGMSVAAFMRGVTLLFIEVNQLTHIMGRPPTSDSKRRYSPRRLPQSIGEIVNEQS